VRTYARQGSEVYTFFSAEHHVFPARPRDLDPTQHEHIVLSALARDAAWLLTHPGISFEPDFYMPRYHLLLQEPGYVSIRNYVWASKLVDGFIAYYNIELLEQLQCQPITETEHSIDYWLRRLMRKHDGETFHPLQHLLLIQFVGHSVQSFLKTSEQPQFFGAGPWPCLNLFCAHYQQEVITECVIQPQLNHNKVEGVFECSCGFVYARIPNSNARQHSVGYSRVVSYGDVWKTGFTQLWNDPQMSAKSIAKAVHITEHSVVQFAAFLHLSFEHRKNKPPNHVAFSEQLVSRHYRRDYNRQLITDTLKANPGISRKELSRKHSAPVAWLLSFDPDWANEHLPAQRRKVDPVLGKRTFVDWENRDTELAAEVRKAEKTIRELSGCPLRINRANLAKYMPQEYRRLMKALEKYLDHFPRTRAVLDTVVDTDISFAHRRIVWGKAECRQGKFAAIPTAFATYAHIRHLLHIPEVKEAFEQALAELQQRACD
jgi:hypothetical protein